MKIYLKKKSYNVNFPSYFAFSLSNQYAKYVNNVSITENDIKGVLVMKKILSIALSFIMILQMSTTAFAFVDTKNNIFTGSKYTHDDKFSGYEIVNGLDISVHQGTISNFNTVKSAGVDYMFLRAGYRGYGSAGSLNKDTMFDSYAKGAVAAGIDIGAYIYSQAITVAEARAEADYIVNIVKGYEITLPLVFDYEYYSGGRLSNANLSTRQRTDICLAFCERVEAAGYTACVYANRSMFRTDLYTDEIANKYIIWLAQYNTSTVLGGSYFPQDYEYWQYTSSGSVSGISGRIELINCSLRYWRGSALGSPYGRAGMPSGMTEREINPLRPSLRTGAPLPKGEASGALSKINYNLSFCLGVDKCGSFGL